MRSTLLALATMILAASCGNADLNQSLEIMNEGIMFANNQQYQQSEEAFKKAGSLYEENHQAWYNLGQVHVMQKEWEEASDAFEKAVKNKNDDAMYQYHLGKSQYEWKREAGSNDLSLAQTALEEAVKLNPRLYKAHYFLGKIYYAQDKPTEAANAWTTSAKLNPLFGRPFKDLGELYWRWDMFPQAISVLSQGADTVKEPDEKSEIYHILGLAYTDKGEFDKAVDAFGKSLAAKADNMEAKLQRGFAYAKKGDSKAAKQDLEEFVKQGGGGNAFNIQAANELLMRLMMEQGGAIE